MLRASTLLAAMAIGWLQHPLAAFTVSSPLPVATIGHSSPQFSVLFEQNGEEEQQLLLYAAANMAGSSSKEKRVRLPRGVRKFIRRLKMQGRVGEAERYYWMEMEKAQQKRQKRIKGADAIEYGARYPRKKRDRRLANK